MRDGFIKAAAGTPSIRVADCHYNAEQCFTMMREAENLGVRLLVFPELCLTGSTCGDLFRQSTLTEGAENALATVLEATRNLEVLTVIGMPVRRLHRLYDCGVVLQHGRILGIIPKETLSRSDETDEARWFSPAPSDDGKMTAELCGRTVRFGTDQLFVCGSSDGHSPLPELIVGVEVGSDFQEPISPATRHTAAGATVILNCAATGESYGKAESRRIGICSQSARLICGYLITNAGDGESSTDLVFGSHRILAENGIILAEDRFQSGLTVSEFDVRRLSEERQRRATVPAAEPVTDTYTRTYFALTEAETVLTRYVPRNPFVPLTEEDQKACYHETLLLASLGLKKRFEHVNADCAVVGLSGGLDSTLAILITALAMKMLHRPASDIIAVTMPCFGTSSRTKNNAVTLAERLGATLETVDISDAVETHLRDIGQPAGVRDVTYENAQARERTQVLMDLANRRNGLVIGTGDLSEMALGWETYNGDHMSMYAVNASIPKTLVRHLVNFVSDTNAEEDQGLSDVLTDILATPVSPELLPAIEGQIAQKTEDIVGPYELHDFFLYYAVRWAFPPRKIYRMAQYAFRDVYSGETILKWLRSFYRRFFSQQFKRSCAPDGPKVGPISLSPRGGFTMPSDAVAELWNAELEELS